MTPDRPVQRASVGALLPILIAAIVLGSSGCLRMARAPDPPAGESHPPGASQATPHAEPEAGPDPLLLAATRTLLPVEALRQDRLLRQRVRVVWAGHGEAFEAVLQKRGSELVMLGLGPMNSVGFRLTLQDGVIEFENRTGRELPFDPAFILADVQRAYYPWFPAPPDCTDCERSGRQAGLIVRERFEAGRLVERNFSVPGREGSGVLQIRYAFGAAPISGDGDRPGRTPEDSVASQPGAESSRLRLENRWIGYTLEIETLSDQRLD